MNGNDTGDRYAGNNDWWTYQYHWTPVQLKCSKCGNIIVGNAFYQVDGQWLCGTCANPPSYTAPNSYPNHPYPTYAPWPKANSAWVCPKCGRVYSDSIMACHACNAKITAKENEKVPPMSCENCKYQMKGVGMHIEHCQECKHRALRPDNWAPEIT